MPSHLLTNFEILKYKSIIQSNLNLMVFIQEIIYLKKKDEAYIINLDDYKSIGTHWIALDSNNNNVTYFYSFGVSIFQTKLKNLKKTKIS